MKHKGRRLSRMIGTDFAMTFIRLTQNRHYISGSKGQFFTTGTRVKVECQNTLYGKNEKREEKRKKYGVRAGRGRVRDQEGDSSRHEGVRSRER